MLILFCFVFQAVSFEYRSKPRNFLGSRTYEVFLMINGYAGPLLLGAAVATFFTGSPFRLSPLHQVEWLTPWRGLDALFVFTNYLLAFAVFFLARTMACLYFITNLEDDNLQIRCRKQLWYNTIPFLITFLLFLAFILTGDGYGILQNGSVGAVPYKYFYNLLEMPINTLLFILGVIAVLFGIFKTLARPQWKKEYGLQLREQF